LVRNWLEKPVFACEFLLVSDNLEVKVKP